MRLYECRIYNDPQKTILLRNFLPCIKKSTNTVGLYDTVSKLCYD